VDSRDFSEELAGEHPFFAAALRALGPRRCIMLPLSTIGSFRGVSMRTMSLRRFGQIVRRVMDRLPEEIQQYLDNVVVDVEEEPDEETLRGMGFTDEEIAAGESLYGLFAPLPLLMPDDVDTIDQPHRILIFKKPLEEDFPEPRQLQTEIRKTVIHELAHHFGWTDRDLERFDNTEDPFGEERS
jgi:predicted Zn-dependent protease with MMP-like domain